MYTWPLNRQGFVTHYMVCGPKVEPFVSALREEGNWLLLRKGDGYIGFWSSVAMEPWNGMNAHCERRMWGDEIACLVCCAGAEALSMEAFAQRVQALSPVYNEKNKQLTAQGFSLTWQKGQDDTQAL